METEAFSRAISLGDLRSVLACLKKGVDPNLIVDETTALHLATEQEDMPLLLRLTEHKDIKINLRRPDGDTALLLGCRIKVNPKFVLALLKSGANPNVKDNFGKTCLHISVVNRDIKTVLCLLKYKAQINIFDTFGNTPLSLACIDASFFPLVKLLISKEADPNHYLHHKLPMFLEFCLSFYNDETEDIFMYLLKHGVNPYASDELMKKNALHIVSLSGNTKFGTKLLRKRLDIQKKDAAGRTPVQIAQLMDVHDMKVLYEDYMFYLDVLHVMTKKEEPGADDTFFSRRDTGSTSPGVSRGQSFSMWHKKK